MKQKWFSGLLIVLALTGLAWIPALATSRPSTELAPGPKEVVSDFYHWYIGYIRNGETLRNPLVDGAYRNRRELSPALVNQIAAAFENTEKTAYDPILLAQDIPERVEVTGAKVSQGAAQVTVEFYWGGNDNPSQRTLDLALQNGNWEITNIAF